jgi:nickel transport protein
MFKKSLRQLLLAAAIFPLVVQPAMAHVIWFDYNNGEYDVLFGHPEDGAEPYNPEKFKSVTGYDQNKQEVPVEIKKQSESVSVVPKGDIAALTAFFDNGFFVTKSPGNSENVSESEAKKLNPDFEVGHFLKYTKALYDWSEVLKQPFGLPLEIQALKNPFELKSGELLPVQVLYQGNLLKNPTVEYEGETYTINEDGIALVPYVVGGFQPIEASYALSLDNDPAADRLSYETSFSAEQQTSVPEPSALLGLSVLGLMAFARKQGKGLKSTK